MRVIPNFGWLEAGVIAGMADPAQVGDDQGAAAVAQLRREGVGAIVSLTEEGLSAGTVAGLAHLHLPIPDMEAPGLACMERFVEFVDACRQRGLAVAVHCTAGRGRTGTMLAVYLVSQGRSADSAIALVRALRPGSIETLAQADAVRSYAGARRAGM